jgi:hypothetical protein
MHPTERKYCDYPRKLYPIGSYSKYSKPNEDGYDVKELSSQGLLVFDIVVDKGRDVGCK